MYKDCLNNEINVEILPDNVFSKIPDYLLSSSYIYEFSSIKCSKPSYKKLVDAYITDLRIIICYNSMFHQLDSNTASTRDGNLVFNYNFFVFKICDLKDQSLHSCNLDYIKLKFIKQVDIKYVKKRKLPLVVLQNDSRYTDYSKQFDEIISTFHHELPSSPSYLYSKENASYDSLEESSTSSHRYKDTNKNIDIDIDYSDFDYEGSTATEDCPDGSCTPLSKFSSIIEDNYYYNKNNSNTNAKNSINDNESESFKPQQKPLDFNDRIDFNYILDQRTNLAFSEEQIPQQKSSSQQKEAEQSNNQRQRKQQQPTDFDNIVLALPSNQLYFPNDMVKDFKITNKYNKEAILQLLHELQQQQALNAEGETTPKVEILVGLFFSKSANNKSSPDFISSIDQVNQVGVKARLVSYSLTNDLTTGESTLSVNFQVLTRIRIECLFIPKYQQGENSDMKNFNIEDYLSFAQFSVFDFQVDKEFKIGTYFEILKYSLTFFKIYCNILNKLRKSINYESSTSSFKKSHRSLYRRLYKTINLNIHTFKKSNNGASLFKILENANSSPYFDSSEFLNEFSIKIEFLIDMIRLITSFKLKQRKTSLKDDSFEYENDDKEEFRILENLVNSDSLEYTCDQITNFYKTESELLVCELKL